MPQRHDPSERDVQHTRLTVWTEQKERWESFRAVGVLALDGYVDVGAWIEPLKGFHPSVGN